jgi:hypothetical protein
MVARQGDPFGEIMIVNPLSYKGERRMKLYPINKSALYGYIAAEPEELGYFAEEPYEMGYMPDEIGYIADPPPGFTEGFGYAPTEVAYVAEEPEFVKTSAMGYAHDIPETVGYFAEEPYEMGEDEDGMGYVYEVPDEMGYFAQEPDEMGEGEEGEMGYFAEEPDEMGEDESEMGYFAEEPENVEGYVRETREPGFSPRVVPADKISGLEGYIRPKMINPTCESILPAEVVSKPASDWFKPLW